MSRVDKLNLERYTQNVKAYVAESLHDVTMATFSIPPESVPVTIELTALHALVGRVTIDWGDNTTEDCYKLRHTYTTAGVLTCKIYNVTTIGDEAFKDITNLISIAIGNSVREIGANAFYNCSALTSVDLGRATTIGRNAFQKTALTAITIPESVTSMGNNIFNGVTTLERAEFNAAMDKIPSGTFVGCTNLNRVVFSDSVTTISSKAFMNTALTSIVIPKSVTTIGANAFYGCIALTIYCEVEEENTPSGWDSIWNPSNRPVVWGYFEYEEQVQKLIDEAIAEIETSLDSIIAIQNTLIGGGV